MLFQSEAGIIDTHVHLWDVNFASKTWLTPSWGSLFRSFDSDDLEKVCNQFQVKKCVLVESGQDNSSNDYLNRLSYKSNMIAAIIPWIDLESKRLEKDIAYWRINPKFRGIRVQVESLPDNGYLLKKSVLNGLAVLEDQGIIYEFLIRTRHLSQIIQIYERCPRLKGIINHLAKPQIATGEDAEEWRFWMKQLASIPYLHCKISGLINEAGDDWNIDRIKPYVEFVVDNFGFDRLVWGSDWPISTKKTTYEATLKIIRESIGTISAIDEDKFFRTTAIRFYDI